MRKRRRRRNQNNDLNGLYQPPAAALESGDSNPNGQYYTPEYSLSRQIILTIVSSILINQLLGPLLYLLSYHFVFAPYESHYPDLVQHYMVLLVFDWLFIAPFSLFLLIVLISKRYTPDSLVKKPGALAGISSLFAILFIFTITVLISIYLSDNVKLSAMLSVLTGVVLPAGLTGYFVARFWH
jgi:hypothetical protein